MNDTSELPSRASAPSSDMPMLCTTVDDLLTPPAREAMLHVLHPFLAELDATPLELLHTLRLQQALEAHPIRRTVCDRAARAQAAAHGLSPATRLKDLEALVTEAAARLPQRIKQASPSVIPEGSFPTALEALAARTPGETFTMDASIAMTLASCRNRLVKIDLLLGWLETAIAKGASGAAVDRADAFLGEQIAFPGVLRSLSGLTGNLDDLLNLCLDLHLNGVSDDTPLPTPLQRLSALLRAAPLPGCRAGLTLVLLDGLQSEERLVEQVAGDMLGQKSLLADLRATANLVRRLKQPEGFIGGRRTHDVLDRRVSLLVSTDKLQEILRGRTVLDKLRDLFHLQHAVAETSSTKTIDDYILLLMESRDFVGRLNDAVEGTEARLRALSDLQDLVLKSTFPQATRKTLAKQLDAAQHDLLKTTPYLSSLRKSGRPSIDAMMTVVDLAGNGTFTRGRCMTEARELIRRHIRHKDFVRKYLKSLQKPESADAPDSPEAEAGEPSDTAAHLNELAARIRKAGVEFCDLSQLRVLVAEDEDSARSYIEMVLKDMGVGHVITAHDGRSALEVFQDFEDGIDLIICDWMMPRMSGLDFLKQVRSVRPHLPFLMVTALATLENVEEAMQQQVTAYIAKPFPPEQLEEKVLLLVNRAAPNQSTDAPD